MDNNIPVFHIPSGHSRFDYRINGDGTFDLIVYESDKQLAIGKHTHKELWDDQLTEAKYVIRFDNLEHIKGYGNALYNFCNVMLKIIREKKEKDNASRNTES